MFTELVGYNLDLKGLYRDGAACDEQMRKTWPLLLRQLWILWLINQPPLSYHPRKRGLFNKALLRETSHKNWTRRLFVNT